MSHVAKMKVKVLSLDALKAAAKQLGLEFIKDQKQYKWFGKHVGDYPLPEGFSKADLGNCDYALRIKDKPGAYEIGIVKNKNGKPGYTLLWDFWAGGYGLESVVGKDGQKLGQEYAVQVGLRNRLAEGYQVERKTDAEGNVFVTARR